MSPSLGPLIVGATFALVEALPEEPLTGELPAQVRRMMIADHLAFGALERLRPRDADAMQALATQFQLTALDTAAQEHAHDHRFDPSQHRNARRVVRTTPFGRRALKLEHPANVGPLMPPRAGSGCWPSACSCRPPRTGTWRCR